MEEPTMTMHYSDPKRATDPHSLPDLEVWQDDEATCLNLTCDWSGPACMADDGCPDCRRNTIQVEPSGWWYWSCLPGCLPDGDPMGPFDTEEEALEDARSDCLDEELSEEMDRAIQAARAEAAQCYGHYDASIEPVTLAEQWRSIRSRGI